MSALERVERLFHDHHRFVHQLCLARLRQPSDADDAVQEVFIRAARHLDRLDPDPRPWLTQVARTVCADEHRRRGRQASALERTCREQPQAAADPEREVVGRSLVQELLACLTEAERRVATEVWLLGHTHEQAAANLGVRGSTTRVLLSRARHRLQALMQTRQDLFGNVATGWMAHIDNRLRQALRQLTNPALLESVVPAGAAVAVALGLVLAGGALGAGARSGEGASSAMGSSSRVAVVLPGTATREAADPPRPGLGRVPALAPVPPPPVTVPTPPTIGQVIHPPATPVAHCVNTGHGYLCPNPGYTIQYGEGFIPPQVTNIPSPAGNPLPQVIVIPIPNQQTLQEIQS